MDCRAVVALMPWNDKYQFEMMARDSQYVAFGLSEDNKMVCNFNVYQFATLYYIPIVIFPSDIFVIVGLIYTLPASLEKDYS